MGKFEELLERADERFSEIDAEAVIKDVEQDFGRYLKIQMMIVGQEFAEQGVDISTFTTDADKIRLSAALLKSLTRVLGLSGGYADLLKIADEMDTLGWENVS
jgi:hypothetical protein